MMDGANGKQQRWWLIFNMCAAWGGIIDDKQCLIKIIKVMVIGRPEWIKKVPLGNNARFH